MRNDVQFDREPNSTGWSGINRHVSTLLVLGNFPSLRGLDSHIACWSCCLAHVLLRLHRTGHVLFVTVFIEEAVWTASGFFGCIEVGILIGLVGFYLWRASRATVDPTMA